MFSSLIINWKQGIGVFLILLLGGTIHLRAEEGMWIPMLIEKYHIGAMQEAGLRLSAEDIYSINQACLKDAIVIFGRGCTGELISKNGLLLTNHHCGESVVQSHSSVENDYLKFGFWAKSQEEELPNNNLTVTFLRYMKDVTESVYEGLENGMKEEARERLKNENMGRILREATDGTYLDATVKPFYYGNAYYLFVYEKYRDVRLVGAPPVSIGNFGGDQDNWMWPRHTGDFSIFRIYADEDNNPADYNPTNRPYMPKRHLEISAGGIDEGDFTMILGYPGSTTQYLHSLEVKSMLESSLPLKIRLRTTRLEVMDTYMKQSDKIRIQYSTKYRRVSNAWKKWQGIILGLKRMHVVENKLKEEVEFKEWVERDGLRQLKYDALQTNFTELYREYDQYLLASDLMDEAILPVELFTQGSRIQSMMKLGSSVEAIERQVNGFFKDFHMPVDREIFAAMMEICYEQMPPNFQAPFLQEVHKKYKGDWEKFAEVSYENSIFSDRARFMAILENYAKSPESTLKKISRDPILRYLDQFREIFRIEVNPEVERINYKLEKNYKTYMQALIEKSSGDRLFPDANFTMRLTYGKVQAYQPRDGINYKYSTTLSGIMEKGKLDFEDYQVPERLSELYENKDFGKYGINGTMPVCFTASNHTSGGNSGSPVLDAEGRLIGINFDRNWEGTMSDVNYNPEICRNIAVDIRYVLFIIDKYAGAGYLLNEMDIIW